MAKFRDVVAGLGRQVSKESADIDAINIEKAKLEAAYRKYQELSELARPKEERLEIAAGLLLNMPLRKVKARTGTFEEIEEGSVVPVDVSHLEISEFPLWKVTREIVRQTSEIRIVNLETTLKAFGVRTSRQSIESALATHKKEFKIAKRGREKFVSLK